jgi:pilus assembly protein Flp/PilA
VLCTTHERGQGLVEYAFIILLVAMVVFVVLTVFGPTIGNVFSKMNNSLASFH